MSGTHAATMDDRGRLVIPGDVRERLAPTAGVTLLVRQTRRGRLPAAREQARDLVRGDLVGRDPLADLLAERRGSAEADERG